MGTGAWVRFALVFSFASFQVHAELAIGRGPRVPSPNGERIAIVTPARADIPKLVESLLKLPDFDKLDSKYRDEFKKRVSTLAPDDFRTRIYYQVQAARDAQIDKMTSALSTMKFLERRELADELMKWVTWNDLSPTMQAEQKTEWFAGTYNVYGFSAAQMVAKIVESANEPEQEALTLRYRNSIGAASHPVAKKMTAHVMMGFPHGFDEALPDIMKAPGSSDTDLLLEAAQSQGYLSKATLSAADGGYAKKFESLYASPALSDASRARLAERFLHSERPSLVEAVFTQSDRGLNFALLAAKIPTSVPNRSALLAEALRKSTLSANLTALAEELSKTNPPLARDAVVSKLKDLDSDLPQHAMAWLKSRGELTSATPGVLDLLRTKSDGVREKVAELLLEEGIGPEKLNEKQRAAMEDFLKALLLNEKRPPARTVALKLLERFPFDSVLALVPRAMGLPLGAPHALEHFEGTEEWLKQLPATFEQLPYAKKRALAPELAKRLGGPQLVANAAAEMLTKIGGREGVSALIAAAKQPPEDRLTRKLITNGITSEFAKLGEADRKALGPQYESLFHLDPANPAAYDIARMMRFQAPTAKRVEKDRAAKAGKAPVDICAVACNIYNRSDEWAKDELFLNPDTYFSKDKPANDWEVATKSISALFMLSAAPYCDPKRERIKKMAGWFKIKDGDKKAPAPDLAEERRMQLAAFDNLGLTAKTDAEKAAHAAARAFLEQGLNRSEKPDRSTEVYGKNFLSLMLRRWEQSPANKQIADSVNTMLLADLGVLHKYPTEGDAAVGNSLGTYHLFLSSLIGSEFSTEKELQNLSAQLERLKGAFAETRKENEKKFRDEAEYMLPYKFSGKHSKTTHPLESRGTVPMGYFALYKHAASPAEKEGYRENLVKSLELYDRDFVDYFALAGQPTLPDGFHDRTIGAQIAPYFGPATIPYVAAFTKVIIDDPKATADQKKRAREVQASLRDKLAEKLQKNGLFVAQDPTSFHSAAAYDNPQVGLAFLSLLDPDRDKCPGGAAVASVGILDPESPGVFANGPRKKGSH